MKCDWGGPTDGDDNDETYLADERTGRAKKGNSPEPGREPEGKKDFAKVAKVASAQPAVHKRTRYLPTAPSRPRRGADPRMRRGAASPSSSTENPSTSEGEEYYSSDPPGSTSEREESEFSSHPSPVTPAAPAKRRRKHCTGSTSEKGVRVQLPSKSRYTRCPS